MQYNRVKETTTTTWLGDYTPNGAVAGHKAFSSIPEATTFSYCVETSDRTIWEINTGVRTGASISRTFVESSTGAAINWSAGTRVIYTLADADTINSFVTSSHNHSGVYEPANANIQSHVTAGHAPSNADNTAANQTSHADVVVDGDFASQGIMKRGATPGAYSVGTDGSTNWDTAYTHSQAAHAPSGAQANADITLAEIEAKLTGVIASHSHSGGGGDPFTFKGVMASIATTGANTTPINVPLLVFSFAANSTYQIFVTAAVSAAAATTGCGFQLDTSVAVTVNRLTFFHQLANTGTLSGGNSIADDASQGVSSGIPSTTAIYPVFGGGVLVSGANPGTAQLRFRSETTAAITCHSNSTMSVLKIA